MPTQVLTLLHYVYADLHLTVCSTTLVSTQPEEAQIYSLMDFILKISFPGEILILIIISAGDILAIGSQNGSIYLFRVSRDGFSYKKSNKIRGAQPLMQLDWSLDGNYLQTVTADYDLAFCKFKIKHICIIITQIWLLDFKFDAFYEIKESKILNP